MFQLNTLYSDLQRPHNNRLRPSHAVFLSAIELMVLSAFSSLPTEHVLVVVGIVLTTCFFMLRRETRKLPPIANEGYFETISIFMTGKGVPQFMLRNMRELGSVYRIRLPEPVPWIAVCDPAFARKILMEVDEKPFLYKRFDGFTRVSTLFSSRTHGEMWGGHRKNLAPSFSMMNICITLPKMYEKIEELKRIFKLHERDCSIFEISEVTTRLTMDFICAGILRAFYFEFHSLVSPINSLRYYF